MIYLFISIIMCSLNTNAQNIVQGEKNTDGSFKKWHKIEVVLDGPNLTEASATFRNYRLDVTFISPTNKKYLVPGFFAGAENAANTGITKGNKWKARFAGGEEGNWTYSVSFVTGTNVAANLTGGTTGTVPDGLTGTFQIGKQDKSGKDFRAKGKLEYVGKHYLQFADGDYFVKCGANSPEVLFGDIDFDATGGIINHTPQVSSWNTGDPTWNNGKGKGIIGTVNYLSEKGVNGHYFLSMNVAGDGKETFPWVANNQIDVYDLSKLEQWELVFTQFDIKGLMIQFVTTENENANFFEDNDGNGTFANARKIYYRELIARFGHHMAITWNVGEENNWATPANGNKPNTTTQRKAFADRIKALTYYNDNISVHNGPSTDVAAKDIFDPLVGYANYSAASLQYNFGTTNHADVRQWWDKSENSVQKWMVSMDEPYNGTLITDAVKLRKETVWGSIMTGGHMEFYLGGGFDLKNIDYSDYAAFYTAMGTAAGFMNTYLAKELGSMSPNDNLITGTTNWALANAGTTYLFYLKNGGTAEVNLSAGVGIGFTAKWFNPVSGGNLQDGAIKTVIGGNAKTNLGSPPNNTTQDWVLLLTKTSSPLAVESEESVSNQSIVYPNPSNTGVFQISRSNNWEVFSMEGVKIKEGNGVQIDISNQNKGLYIVKMGNKTQKLIIE